MQGEPTEEWRPAADGKLTLHSCTPRHITNHHDLLVCRTAGTAAPHADSSLMTNKLSFYIRDKEEPSSPAAGGPGARAARPAAHQGLGIRDLS